MWTNRAFPGLSYHETGALSDRLPVGEQEELDAPILLATAGGAVVGDRLGRPIPDAFLSAIGRDPRADQPLAHRIRTRAGELRVELRRAARIGVTLDAHVHVFPTENGRDLGQERVRVGQDCRLPGLEMDLLLELDLVVVDDDELRRRAAVRRPGSPATSGHLSIVRRPGPPPVSPSRSGQPCAAALPATFGQRSSASSTPSPSLSGIRAAVVVFPAVAIFASSFLLGQRSCASSMPSPSLSTGAASAGASSSGPAGHASASASARERGVALGEIASSCLGAHELAGAELDLARTRCAPRRRARRDRRAAIGAALAGSSPSCRRKACSMRAYALPPQPAQVQARISDGARRRSAATHGLAAGFFARAVAARASAVARRASDNASCQRA